jgi:hypothetical protein
METILTRPIRPYRRIRLSSARLARPPNVTLEPGDCRPPLAPDRRFGRGSWPGRSPAQASLCVPAGPVQRAAVLGRVGPAARFVAKPKLGAATQLSGSGSAGRRARGRALMCRHERDAAAQSVADSVVTWLPAALGGVASPCCGCPRPGMPAFSPRCGLSARPRAAHDCLDGWKCGGMSTPGEDGHPRSGAGIDPDRPASTANGPRQPHAWRPG